MKGFLLLAALACAAPLTAQTAGETGATVLKFNAGSRAAALSGAYSSAYGDADALFFNPAGIAAMGSGASFSYETRASGIALGSLAAFTHIRALRLGASLVYLDAGDIDEIVPAAEFGFNTGTTTGNRLDAGEIAARVSMALPLVAGLSASHGSRRAASAIVRSNAARAEAGSSPSCTPRRPSATSRSGTLDAQSPARMVPIEMG